MTAIGQSAPRLRRPLAGGGRQVFEYKALVYRRVWRGSVFSTFLSPVLFLAAMGVGLGSFVDHGSAVASLGGVSYAAFLAPGLLAAQGMQTAASESTWAIMGGFVWDRTFHGMYATPVTVVGIIAGQLAWVTARLTLVATAFFVVMLAFGFVVSPFGVLGIGASVLTGLAFAAPITAFAASQKNDQAFNVIFRFFITPLFLFSGTFFPIEQLPLIIRPIAWLTPTWHGVALARGLSLGSLDPIGALVHLAVLVAYIVAGTAWALIAFRRALSK
ncbi:MAG TPA: ABC transporter permease [Verrucomicrobiae bacterium]|nr:ABC transporter permease [Verrucomicrobiae bacterium]